MADLTSQSDRLIAESRALRDDNRSGGRHRRGPPIGRGSGRIRRKNLKQRLTYMVYAFVFTWGYDTLFPPQRTAPTM